MKIKGTATHRALRLPGLFILGGLLAPLAQAGALFNLVGNPHVYVEGFGFFNNIGLVRSLEILEPQEEELAEFDSIFVEDALWILSGEVKRQGYLYPAISVKVFDGEALTFEGRWQDDNLEPDIPADITGDRVFFMIEAGQLFFYDSVQVEGLPDEFERAVAPFFYPTDRLYVSNKDRFFTAGRFQSGLDGILTALRDLGYRQSKVEKLDYTVDRETGQVAAQATIAPGPIIFVRELEIQTDVPLEGIDGEAALPPIMSETRVLEDRRYTPDWMLSELQRIRKRYYRAGYPDAEIESEVEVLQKSETEVAIHLTLVIQPGEKIYLADVKYEGKGDTQETILDQQTRLKDGEPLNRLEVEEGRDRLSRLGVFRSIGIDYEAAEPEQRKVIYDLTLKQQTAISLIFGVGSFDIVRIGFEVIQRNLWGLAHHSELTAVQSLKGTYADYTYWIPQIFGEDLDFYLSANYLRREEISFDREEYGGQAGVQHFFKSINTTASAGLSYELVDAANTDFQASPGPRRAFVSSLLLRANRTELNNPIFPTNGWQVFGRSQLAFKQLGGQVQFTSLEVGGAWHKPVNESGLTFHAGYKTGVVTSFGSAEENIPVTSRFFLGGENTVRGYRRDQASPVNAKGQQIGAVSYMLWQVEFEQRLSELISVVAFCDTVGNAAEISEYPFNEVLISVGAGISIRTVVGPLRFEYGYNVKKRSVDPDGTFQVALGFPF